MFVKNTLLISRTLYGNSHAIIRCKLPYMFKPSWQGGYAARKKGAYLIISAVVWGSIPMLYFVSDLQKSYVTKSTWSPCRVPPLWGLYRESLRTSWGLLGDSLGTGRTSAKLGLIPKESLGTPQRLLRDSSRTPQQHVAQCNDLDDMATASATSSTTPEHHPQTKKLDFIKWVCHVT